MNRGANGCVLFNTKRDYHLFYKIYTYYLKKDPQIRYSQLMRLPFHTKASILENHQNNESLCSIVAYCLMPNHFHFIAVQHVENGLSTWLSKASNSYSSIFNKRHSRKGTLFQTRFKSVHITTTEQLIHVARYIHLNPVTAQLTPMTELDHFQHSSFRDYSQNKIKHFSFPLEKKVILHNYTSLSDFRSFTFDQADYQRELKLNQQFYSKLD